MNYKKCKIEDKVETYNALLGCIKFEGNYYFYLMPVAWWILDYKKYDPKNSKEDNFNFRNNIFVVTNENVDFFMKSIEDDKISLIQLQEIIKKYSTEKYKYDNYNYLYFYIDFDKYIYINGLFDVGLEDYLPDPSWTGKFDNPLNYMPEDIKKIWLLS